MPTKAVWVLAGALVVLTGWNWYLSAENRGPFRTLAMQDDPPATLFEHRDSGTCFVGWKAGGLVVVDSEVCRKSGGIGLLPIIPIPLPPLSPEK